MPPSGAEQERLRAVAQWAVAEVRKALAVLSDPDGMAAADAALAAAAAFANGARRTQELRRVSLAAFRAAHATEGADRHVLLAASLAAAVAYTHTDITEGGSGMRQARHLLGPAVHAALARELAGRASADAAVAIAAATAPDALTGLLATFPPQPPGRTRLETLFHALDGVRAP